MFFNSSGASSVRRASILGAKNRKNEKNYTLFKTKNIKKMIKFYDFQEVYPKANVTPKQFGNARAIFSTENERTAEISDAKAIMAIIYRKKEKIVYDAEKRAKGSGRDWLDKILSPRDSDGYNHFYDND